MASVAGCPFPLPDEQCILTKFFLRGSRCEELFSCTLKAPIGHLCIKDTARGAVAKTCMNGDRIGWPRTAPAAPS
jgi:hypothetical protein